MSGGRYSAVTTLARRFLLSKSSDQFLSFIAWVAVSGVALGVLALTVVTSVINGFEDELVKVITSLNGDVVLYSRGEPVQNPERVEEKIRRVLPNVQSITSSFVVELMVSGELGVAGAVLEGVDFANVGGVTRLPDRLIAGTLPSREQEVAVGSYLAERIGAKVGDEIKLVAPFVGEEIEGETQLGIPKIIKVKVSGIIRMGMHEYDSKFIFARIADVQTFLKQPDRVTSFKIKLQNSSTYEVARAASDRLTDNFGYPFRAKDWGQLNKNILYAIRLEKAVIAVVLTVIIIVAAFNVVSTLMMMIHDKTKEIAILKAMGLRPMQGFQLFSIIGMGIGAVGVLGGIALGMGVNWLLASTQLTQLPAEIYYIGFLPVIVNWNEIVLIALGAGLIIFAATLYPAIQVSRRPPLEGIRYE